MYFFHGAQARGTVRDMAVVCRHAKWAESDICESQSKRENEKREDPPAGLR